MSKKRRTPPTGKARAGGGRRTEAESTAAVPTVTVCRGCCCGTRGKHPDVDHADQLQRLRQHDARAVIRISDCLGVCERSNVIVISPSPGGRAAGAKPVWLGDVLDHDAVTDIGTWLKDGGPGLTNPPPTLELYVFSPSRRIRATSPTPD